MRVVGIETSCDETGIAIYDGSQGLLADVLHSQVMLHQSFGGVVPELASRDHIVRLLPLLQEAMQQAKTRPGDLDAIAYTQGPGLVGALMVGASLAKSLAYAWNIPSIGVHHMEGHLLAPMLESQAPEPPFLALLISGGHTLLVAVHAIGEYVIVGQSLDDAVGEAFDKTAKLLGLPYPGGPKLAACAMKGRPGRFTFPRPMIDRPGLDFSFSGLKTAVAEQCRTVEQTPQTLADIAYAFQEAVISTLLIKSQRALEQTQLTRWVIAGGVSANQALRSAAQQAAEAWGVSVFFPRPAFSTDNGAMIAYAGYCRLMRGARGEDEEIVVKPRWPLSDPDLCI